MLGGDDDQHDVVAGGDRAMAVDHGDGGQRPARGRLLGNADDLALRHAGIVLQFQRRQAAVLRPAYAGEADDGADLLARLLDPLDLGVDVEAVRLHADRHLNGHGAQPPVMGGKIATSSAPSIGTSPLAWTLSTAMRTARGSARAIS